MKLTHMRDLIKLYVSPEVLAKAATIAAEHGNKTAANVLEEWISNKMEEMDREEERTKA